MGAEPCDIVMSPGVNSLAYAGLISFNASSALIWAFGSSSAIRLFILFAPRRLRIHWSAHGLQFTTPLLHN